MMSNEAVLRKLAEIDAEAALMRDAASRATARLAVLRAERKKVLTENQAPLTPGQIRYAGQIARKRAAG